MENYGGLMNNDARRRFHRELERIVQIQQVRGTFYAISYVHHTYAHHARLLMLNLDAHVMAMVAQQNLTTATIANACKILTRLLWNPNSTRA